MHILYEIQKSLNCPPCEFEIKEYRPTLFKPFAPKETKRGVKNRLSRIWFWLITGGKAKIAYVERDGQMVHTSYVLPKCFKFPFMKKGDFEIGPCVTAQEYRGQGIYPSVLKYIISNYGDDSARFYMIVSDTNAASIRGIEKAGFKRSAILRKTPITKKYVIETRN